MKALIALGASTTLLAVTSIVLATRLGDEQERPLGEPSEVNEALIELARSQERTADVLERLEGVLAERLVTPASEAAPRRSVTSAPPPESFDELIASLDALRTTLEAESQRTQELIRNAPAFGGESLQDIRRRNTSPNWFSLQNLEESWRADEGQADRSQHFQTARDLLEAYGPPSAIYRPKGGILFVYRRHAEGEAGPAWFFRLQDGIVVEFFVEDEEQEVEGQ